MKRCLLLLFFITTSLKAQVVTDDFSDGDFSHNPQWIGDSLSFLVNSTYQLQLHDTAAGKRCLVARSPAGILRNNEWKCWARENFSPSANNYGRVYLSADRSNLKDSVNGYYLQFGEAGSNDAVELFRQTGNSSVSICRGVSGEIASPFQIGVKVTRDSLGKWCLFIDPSGGTNYVLESSGTDTLLSSTSFFGILAVFTQSNDTKFYWDNFYSGLPEMNLLLPRISALSPLSAHSLNVKFNEAIDTASGAVAKNYVLDNGVGPPVSVVPDPADHTLVHLTFFSAFLPNSRYSLTVSNVKSSNGNLMKADSAVFWWYVPREFDVVLNEIMANPSPPVLLPPVEYVELYNRRNFPIKLDNWKFCVGTRERLLGAVTIQPDSFLVLCAPASAGSFPANVAVYPVSGFPALTNTGAELTLKNDSGRVMCSLFYEDNWYGDSRKAGGGWSLEQIDPQNPCGGEKNWIASKDIRGGTPGARNSVFSSNSDVTAPRLLRAAAVSPDTICVYFDKPMDSTSTGIFSRYQIVPGETVQSVLPLGNDFSRALLVVQPSLQASVVYTLSVSTGIVDCVGNAVETGHTVRLGLPRDVNPLDLVINELLTDPAQGGVKYVEVYNRSMNIINLKDLQLCSLDSVTGMVFESKTITSDNYLLFPGDYSLWSESGKSVQGQYLTPNPDGFVDLASMPKMDIGGGCLAVKSNSGTMIDKIVYSASWQFPLLSSTKGVALERVDYDRPSQDPENWHSAAETVGFGTPSYRNSEYLGGSSSAQVTLLDPLFSPDEDGYNDLLIIEYHLDHPGYLGNLQVFDSRGRPIRVLAKNSLLSITGRFSWDGLGDNREKAPVGVYIVFFQIFSLDGTMKEYKMACVLASKL